MNCTSHDPLCRWFHLAVVWDGRVMKVYKNGQLQQTVQASTTDWYQLPFENLMYLGRPNNKNQKRFHGKFAIDEWYFWNNLLSDEEIRSAYLRRGNWSFRFSTLECQWFLMLSNKNQWIWLILVNNDTVIISFLTSFPTSLLLQQKTATEFILLRKWLYKFLFICNFLSSSVSK